MPAQAQADRVVEAEHQADGALAANEGGNRIVDLAGKAADGRRVIARQGIVDALQHRVPVDQQVEDDHRRDQQAARRSSPAPARGSTPRP